MNSWTRKSVDLAKTGSYLDQLSEVYPVSSGANRPLDEYTKKTIKKAIETENDENKKRLIIECCINSEVSPIKDSYIGFLRQDTAAINRNPQTVDRLYQLLKGMGYNKIVEQMERPPESNRQFGSAFKKWVDDGHLGLPVSHDVEQFQACRDDMVLSMSDMELGNFGRIHLGYGRNRGLDFVCRINNKYIIGEAKFISASGGNQSNQLDKALSIFTDITTTTRKTVIPVAILDGVIYIEGRNRQYQTLERENNVILSALLLKNFIDSIGD